MKLRNVFFALAWSVVFSNWSAETSNAPTPLTHAHAHNDYEHVHPLFDALDQGFCSVEADIYLVDGQLLVAHDRNKVSPERTLTKLYLDPLLRRAESNGGRIYQGGPSVTLLIDVKSDADSTYAALRQVLNHYTNMLTSFSSHNVRTGAVTAILSGNRARAMVAQETVRYAAIDGRPEDLDGDAPYQLIPLVSEDWSRLFRWRGNGQFPEAEKTRLHEMIKKAHAQGRAVRFWNTPDRPEMWRALLASQVDWINADDLSGLRAFCMKYDQAGGH